MIMRKLYLKISRHIRLIHYFLKYNNISAFFLVLIITTMMSCGSSIEISPQLVGYEFYPLHEGLYRDYKVRYIRYTILNDPDTLNYYLREQVADSFLTQSGNIAFKLYRYKKLEYSPSWELDSVWTAQKTSTNVVVTENNIPFVKLIFPVKDHKTWNGNAFNTMGEESYSYDNVFIPISIGENMYNSSLRVKHQDNSDVIVKTDLRNEIYAENIGLIYKESIILHYCTDNHCLGDTIIERGSKYSQELIGYGKE